MIKIYYTDSASIPQRYTITQLLSMLPKTLEKKALRYRFEQDSYNFLLGRLLLKQGLMDLGYSPSLLENIYYNEQEKPLLKEVFFSISHAKNLVACAISDKYVMGLDVEMPRKLNRHHFKASFSEKEWKAITADDSMHTFYIYWTQKEAILKANGVGLDRLMDIELRGSLATFKTKNGVSKWQLNRVFFPDFGEAYGYLCCDEEVTFDLEQYDINK